jgi:hypothetical protein
VLSRCQYGAINGTTHIEMIFSFWKGADKHFIGNGLRNSDDSVT